MFNQDLLLFGGFIQLGITIPNPRRKKDKISLSFTTNQLMHNNLFNTAIQLF